MPPFSGIHKLALQHFQTCTVRVFNLGFPPFSTVWLATWGFSYVFSALQLAYIPFCRLAVYVNFQDTNVRLDTKMHLLALFLEYLATSKLKLQAKWQMVLNSCWNMRNPSDIVKSILEKPDSPVLGNSTLLWKIHFRKIYIVSGPYVCKTAGMLKYLESCRKKIHVLCTEL